MSTRVVTTFLVMIAMLGIGLLIAVATLDPLQAVATSYDLNGMDSQVNQIHLASVKWIVPVALFSFLSWAVFTILRRERQQL